MRVLSHTPYLRGYGSYDPAQWSPPAAPQRTGATQRACTRGLTHQKAPEILSYASARHRRQPRAPAPDRCRHQGLEADECFDCVASSKGKLHWQHFRPEINPETGLACLLCRICDRNLCTSNAARTVVEHFGESSQTKNLCRAQAKDVLGLQQALKRPAFEHSNDEYVMDLIAEAGRGHAACCCRARHQPALVEGAWWQHA
eukprot:364358-Chlamydomonas_euryale.AAC.22